MKVKSDSIGLLRQSYGKKSFDDQLIKKSINTDVPIEKVVNQESNRFRGTSIEARQSLMYSSWRLKEPSNNAIKGGEAMTIREARLKSFLLDTRELSPKNVDTILKNICAIQRAWGITEPTNENALLLKGRMREKGRCSNSIRQYMWALKYWALAYGGDIDFNAVPLPKVERTVPKILDFDMVGKIIDDERLSIRDRIIMMLFAITACRIGELAAVKLMDIDHKEHTVLLHDTKTRKEKIAPIPPRYYRLLAIYLDERANHLSHIGGKTDVLLISLTAWRDKDGNLRHDLTADGIRQAIYRISERYGIDEPSIPGQRRKRNLHPHTMRHTATTKLRQTLVNSEDVMRITGHSTSAMLDWYSHPNLETIKAKMNDLKY
jgi:integrase